MLLNRSSSDLYIIALFLMAIANWAKANEAFSIRWAENQRVSELRV